MMKSSQASGKAPPPHLSPAPPLLYQQVVETGCELVVRHALSQPAVVVLLQPPVQHHLQLTCAGEVKKKKRSETHTAGERARACTSLRASPGLSEATP